MQCWRRDLRRVAVVVPQHAANAFPAPNLADLLSDLVPGSDDLITQALMIPLAMIMLQELSNSPTQGRLLEELGVPRSAENPNRS